MPQEKYHTPVLVTEVLQHLAPSAGGVFLDVTLGGGGHTRAILEAEPTCSVVAMDWDEQAIELSGEPLQEQFPNRLQLIWANFGLLYKIAKKEKIGPFDGILADFGTSQYQIAQKPGFSIFRDAPLDMRMSPGHFRTTAADVVSTASLETLAQIFWQLGEERYGKQIAQAIVTERKKKRIKTTGQLAALVERVVPRGRQKIHPATRVFQALRIHVNRELDNIKAFLPAAADLLKPGGRLVCISFHSLEDRLVKQFFQEYVSKNPGAELVTRRVVTASDQELAANPSSRSARLRALQAGLHDGTLQERQIV